MWLIHEQTAPERLFRCFDNSSSLILLPTPHIAYPLQACVNLSSHEFPMVLSFLALHSKVKDTYQQWIWKLLRICGFAGPEWNWHLFRILWRISGPDIFSIHALGFQLTSCIHLVESAWFSFEPVPLSQSSFSHTLHVCREKTEYISFPKSKGKWKMSIYSGKVDVYKITHFKRLLKQILGNSQVQ